LRLRMRRALRAWQRAAPTALLLLAACAQTPRHPSPARSPAPTSPATVLPRNAPDVNQIPDAVPYQEPRSAFGNPPFYYVGGHRYVVLPSATGYVERGVASWYGTEFHGLRTSTGEPYDMFAMTAAHKTLPLPAYVRVTNLQNGRSIVVRVNDRGPFVGNRIIDLSYTAAAKLDMLRDGTAMVEVRAIDPEFPADNTSLLSAAAAAVTGTTAAQAAPPSSAPAPASVSSAPATSGWTPLPAAALFVQAGAFADHANAERLAAKLRDQSFTNVFVREDNVAGRHFYRVRIGPVPDVPEFDRIVGALERAGVSDAHLALN
jgi:rare lipoprotein A